MSTRSLRTVGTPLPFAGAHVSRRRSSRPGLSALPGVPTLLAAVLPLVGAHAYAASCDNVILPGGATCASTVAAGSAVNNTIVNSGGTQKVKGTANASIINSGGSQAVSSGGLASGTVINGAGVQSVLSGGSAVSSVISGGTQYVSSGGVAVNTVVNSGGSFGVSKGGLAVGAVVSSGGLQRVYSGGLVSGNVIAGGKQYVSAGGTAVATVVNSGGTQAVSSGGMATGTVVNDAGVQTVVSGGSAMSTVVSGGTQYVSSGGVALNTVVNSGGSFGVSNGGLAVGAVVSSGGLQRVYSGGLVSGNVVAGGKQYVSAGGTAVATTVSAGSQVVFTKGSAIDAVVNNSAVQTVSSGGVATGTTVNGGGLQTVLLGGAAGGVVVAAGGTMTLDVGGTTASGMAAAATVEGLSLAGTLNLTEAASDNLIGGAAATIDTLKLNGGTILFSAPGTGGYKTLTVNGLSGSGQFALNTNVGAAIGDQLVVDQASGSYTLVVHDTSSAPPTSASERLMLVNATNSTATFALAGNAIDVGAYKFALQDVGGQYYFYNTGAKSDVAAVAQAASAMPTLLWYQQLEETFAQLADYRGGASDAQLWVRSFDQRLRTSPGGTSTTTDYYGVQIGRDWQFGTRNGNWHVGTTAGFAQGNEDFGNVGDGTARPWNIGAYGGYDGHNGVFVDAVVRYLSMKQAADVTTAANQASASYNLSGYSISLDGGRRLPLAGRWWVEPRAELTYQRSGSVDYQTTFGTLVGLGATNLVLGSAGVSFGASWVEGNFTLDPFINIAATHVLNGNVTNTVGGTALETALPQTWLAASAGVSVALSKRTRAYSAFSYGKGHDYTQPWAVTVGLSYALD